MDVERIFALDDGEFIQALYRELLHREPDEGGFVYYFSLLKDKKHPRRNIVRGLKNSEEYRLLHAKSQIPALVIENRRLNQKELDEGKAILQSKPLTFNLDLIGMCNMKPPCSMCLNWTGDQGPRYHPGLRADDVEAFGEMVRLSTEVVNCSIGEPLILKDLIPILELLSAWQKPIGMNSNGLALTPELTEKLVPFFEMLTIIFSVDAATAETYAKIRGRHFERVVENIGYYCKRRQEAVPEGTASKTGLVMIPMRINPHEVSEFVRLGALLGVDVIELRALNEIKGDWRVIKEDFLFDYRQQMLSRQELEQVREEAQWAAYKYGVILDCQYQVSEEKVFEAFLPEDRQKKKIKCTQPWHFILPYQNGDTVGCCYMGRTLGNWRLEGLQALWNSERMQAIRKEMALGLLPKECREYVSCPVVQAHLASKKTIIPWGKRRHFLSKSA